MRPVLFITLLTLLLLAPAFKAMAQGELLPSHRTRSIEPLQKPEPTAVSAKYANTFFMDCFENRDPNISADSQEFMCTCMAAELMAVMTMEEIDFMKEDSQQGQEAMHKMQTFVFGPCMEFPVRDYAYNYCVVDRKLRKLVVENRMDHEGICNCTASEVAFQISIDGPDIVTRGLAIHPDRIDTLALIMDSRQYRSIYTKYKIRCKTFIQYEQ